MRYQIILNPTAGRGIGSDAIDPISKYFNNKSLDYDISLTERPWHAAELAERAARDGFDVVVSAGGDGTANEVLNGLMRAKTAGKGESVLGILCVGRGNDFAFGLNIPVDLETGCDAIISGHTRWMDVGLVSGGLYPDGRYFGNGVGIGFDAVVGFEALKMKRLSGFISYLVAALKTIFLYYQAPKVQISSDGNKLELSTLMISVMNGRRMGGGFMMAPDAHPDDGLFNVCIAKQVSKAGVFALIPRFMQGSQNSHPAILTKQTRKIQIRALEGSLPAHSDGETLCIDGNLLKIELLPKQIQVISAPIEVMK